MRYGKVMEVVIMYDQEKKKSRGKIGLLSRLTENENLVQLFFHSCVFQDSDFCHLKTKMQLNAVWPTTL